MNQGVLLSSTITTIVFIEVQYLEDSQRRIYMDPVGFYIEVEDDTEEEEDTEQCKLIQKKRRREQKQRERRRRRQAKDRTDKKRAVDKSTDQNESENATPNNATTTSNSRPECIPNRNPTIMVLAGGGSKIVAMLGAMVHILERVPNFLDAVHTWVGTSAGAMLSLLLACGYTIKELQKELTELNMPSLVTYDIGSLMVGKGMGLDSGNKYIEWISMRMVKKGINPSITLSQLKSLTNRSLLTVTTDLYSRSTYMFDCIQDPDVPALFAVRASIGIPLMFTKVFYKDKCLLDGGLAMNFPFRAIVNSLPEQSHDVVFGIDLAFKNIHQGNESLVDYISLLGELFIGLQAPPLSKFENTEGMQQSLSNELPHQVHNIKLSRQYPLLQANEDDKDDLFEDGYNSIH